MFRLAAPLVLAEIGWMAMGVVDTMAVGRVGAIAMGAVSIGAMIFYTIGVFGGGLLLGLDTLVSQAFGAGDGDDCRRSLHNGIWLALSLVFPVMALVWGCIPLLAKLGIDPAVLIATRPYLWALNWSTLPLLLFFTFRRYLQAVNVVRPIMLTLITANLVNLAGLWILVFGHLGAPRMGAEGAGWATCISRLYMMCALGLVTLKHDRDLLRGPWVPDFHRMRQLLELGLPAATQIALEMGVFATVTILIGKLNAIALAGNQIAVTTVSMTFMMPLGISSAAAVRVGQAIGRGDRVGAARSGWTALALGAALMTASAVTLFSIPNVIARLFTPQPEVVAAGAALLKIAAFFQLFDGCQIVATGALRGAGDTRTPMLCHFVGYWVIGLPLGAVLCFRFALGAAGLWMGLSAGLIVIGIVLVGFWRRAVHRLNSSGLGRAPSDPERLGDQTVRPQGR
jgi:MATE family, multidrug efflux pump